jgi:hypothetical protein
MIRFFDGNGGRRTVRLGRMPKRQAESVKRYIEQLVASQLSGSAPPDETSRWLAELGDEFHARLARTGLIAPRRATSER